MAAKVFHDTHIGDARGEWPLPASMNLVHLTELAPVHALAQFDECRVEPFDVANGADQQSDAYKREHGRCSPEFKPIYFEYDQSSIKGDQIPIMEFNGNYLRNNSSGRVLVEGNTDDRGTNEYNLALGERRANAAKKYLIQYGIEASRIRTVSYGEERPLFTGTGEDDYAHNRRDDFILE